MKQDESFPKLTIDMIIDVLLKTIAVFMIEKSFEINLTDFQFVSIVFLISLRF